MTPAHVKTSLAALAVAGTSPHLQASQGITMSASPAAAPIVPSAGTAGMPYDAALAAERKAGAAEERTRIGAILNHEAAAGRGKLAAHLAFKTSMNVEDAGKMLAASATYAGAAFTNGGRVEVLDWSEIVAGLNATLPNAATADQGQAAAGQETAAASAQADAGFSWDAIVAEHNAANGFNQGGAR